MSEVHKTEDEAQVWVVGHKHAMEVCGEKLSNKFRAGMTGMLSVAPRKGSSGRSCKAARDGFHVQ